MAADATAGVPEGEAGGAATVFALLGDCYLEPPTPERLATIQSWATRWLDLDPAPEVATALEPLASVEPAEADSLNEAFTTLFRGVVPDAPDPPYESLYRDGQLQGPSTQAVRAAYRETGVGLAGSTGELVDHLGIELHYAGILMARGDESRLTEFVSSHPGVWFADLRATVEARDPPAFYRGLLALTGLVLSATTDAESTMVRDSAPVADRPATERPASGTVSDRSTTDIRSELDQ